MKITIHNLGPIKDCVIEPSNFTVLMGEQASGKSTIAKCVYFFSTVKDDICEAFLKNQSLTPEELSDILKNKFKRLFGLMVSINEDLKLKCDYAKGISIQISISKNETNIKHIIFSKQIDNKQVTKKLKDNTVHTFNSDDLIFVDKDKIDFDGFKNFIDEFVLSLKISYSNKLKNILEQKFFSDNKAILQNQLNDFFHYDYNIIFIPAGRCLAAQLSKQLNYLYASMGDELKNSLDYTTQKFIETILYCRIALQNGIEGLQSLSSSQWKDDITDLLKGRYICTANGEERLYIPNKPLKTSKYISFHLASSGQQEMAWLLNVVAYYLDQFNSKGSKTMFIIEEPETHLYPAAQKKLMELLAFVANHSQGMFITTHSPYVLGSLNNLLYAGSRPARLKKKIANIIPQEYQLKHIDAFYLKDGKMEVAIDQDMKPLVQNGLIDDASHELNNEFDRMIDLQYLKEK